MKEEIKNQNFNVEDLIDPTKAAIEAQTLMEAAKARAGRELVEAVYGNIKELMSEDLVQELENIEEGKKKDDDSDEEEETDEEAAVDDKDEAEPDDSEKEKKTAEASDEETDEADLDDEVEAATDDQVDDLEFDENEDIVMVDDDGTSVAEDGDVVTKDLKLDGDEDEIIVDLPDGRKLELDLQWSEEPLEDDDHGDAEEKTDEDGDKYIEIDLEDDDLINKVEDNITESKKTTVRRNSDAKKALEIRLRALHEASLIEYTSNKITKFFNEHAKDTTPATRQLVVEKFDDCDTKVKVDKRYDELVQKAKNVRKALNESKAKPSIPKSRQAVAVNRSIKDGLQKLKESVEKHTGKPTKPIAGTSKPSAKPTIISEEAKRREAEDAARKETFDYWAKISQVDRLPRL